MKNLDGILEDVQSVKDICDNLEAIKGREFVQKVQIVHSLYGLHKMANKAVNAAEPSMQGALLMFALDNVTTMVVSFIIKKEEKDEILEWVEVIEKRLIG